MKKWSLFVAAGGVAVAACSQSPARTGPAEPSGMRPFEVGHSVDLAKPGGVSKEDDSRNFEVAARKYAMGEVAAHAVGIPGRMDLRPVSTRTGAGSTLHTRLTQFVDGIPVYGGDLVVHGTSTQITHMSGSLGIGLDRVDVVPRITAEDALATAKADYVGGSQGAFAFERETQDLVVFAREGNVARLAREVRFFTELQNGKDPGLWTYFVDAVSGAVVAKLNELHTASQASGPGGNLKAPRAWSDALDVDPLGAAYVMNTARQETVNMKNTMTGMGEAVVGTLGAIGDPEINDGHGYAEVSLNVLQK